MAHKKLLDPNYIGEILREEFMRPMGVSINQLARKTVVPPDRISAIVNGKRAITADTALRLAKYFGTSSELWLGLQTEYDLRVANARSDRKSCSAAPGLTEEPGIDYPQPTRIRLIIVKFKACRRRLTKLSDMFRHRIGRLVQLPMHPAQKISLMGHALPKSSVCSFAPSRALRSPVSDVNKAIFTIAWSQLSSALPLRQSICSTAHLLG
ncbi:MAG: higA [Nitrospira sp.]|jgi:addiction module HigA family antidote|nr:higA [Nitrospira sp.]